MQLHNTDKQLIIQAIVDQFAIKPKNAEIVFNDLEAAFHNNNNNFFYEMKYVTFFQNNPIFTQKVLQCAFKIFTLLYAKEEYILQRQEIEIFFYRLLENVFIQKCAYAKRIEKKSDVAQKILLHLSEQLNKQLHTQQLMIANISHEMRTSLNAINGYISLVNKKNILKKKNRNYLGKASNATLVLNALVSDILDTTKISAGQLEITEEPFWLDEVILKCIDNISLMVKKKDIVFQSEVDFFPHKFIGDHQHIMEIMNNLLSNAVKYTDSGSVRLVVKKLNESDDFIELLFQVEDSGIGMTHEQIKHIFDPYSRFNTDRRGVGIGLFIAFNLAKRIDGNLSVASEIDKGSTFKFTIKLKKDITHLIKFDNKICCFFNNTNDSKTSLERMHFLEKLGSKVILFTQEQEFINYLNNLKEEIPDIISINTNNNEYQKFNSMINYFKENTKFHQTYFIAVEAEFKHSLKCFDEVYERFAPISACINVLKPLSKHQDATNDISTEDNISILAVDDIETNLEILKLFIKSKYPHAVLDLAMEGYEAIGMCKVKTYDIIFLDLKMPGMNGFEVLEKLKDTINLPPVYALTADIYKDTYDHALQADFAGILEKPLQPELLFKAIEKAVKDAKNNK